jgi:hypothetical protein
VDGEERAADAKRVMDLPESLMALQQRNHLNMMREGLDLDDGVRGALSDLFGS